MPLTCTSTRKFISPDQKNSRLAGYPKALQKALFSYVKTTTMTGSLPPQAPRLLRQFLQSSESDHEPVITRIRRIPEAKVLRRRRRNALSHASRRAQDGCLVPLQVCNRLSSSASSCRCKRGFGAWGLRSVGPWVKKLALARRAGNLALTCLFYLLDQKIPRFGRRVACTN